MSEAEQDPDRRLTREQVSDLLGVHYQTVRTYERTRELPAHERVDGRPLWRLCDVLEFRKRHPIQKRPPAKVRVVRVRDDARLGARAAEVFALLDAGKELVEVVRALKIQPDLALGWWRVWSCRTFDAFEQQVQTSKTEREAERDARARERHDLKMLGELLPRRKRKEPT